MDSTLVIYTGLALPNTPVTPGENLQNILVSIDAALNSSSSAPDYSGYNLQCLRDSYTINTTQQFAEAVADFTCNTILAPLTTFISTTYVNDQSVITTAITGLQSPAFTYAPFSITSADPINTIWTKSFAGFDTIIANADPSGANWSYYSISAPTNAEDAFNAVIAYQGTQDANIADCEPAVGTFDNSSNCLNGGTTDSVGTTMNYVIDYLCSAPAFDASSVQWGCAISPGEDLQTTIQSIVDFGTALIDAVVMNPDTGLTYTPGSGCSGATLGIDQLWSGLYMVGVDSLDTDPDFLVNKIISSDASVSITDTGSALDLSVTVTSDHKVRIGTNDTSPEYLLAKFPVVTGDWGLAIVPTATPDNTQIALKPTISNPAMFIQNFVSTVAGDPDLLALWCTLQPLCAGCLCTAPTGLSVGLGEGVFCLTWTPSLTASYQMQKYRQTGNTEWISTVNIYRPNPGLNSATTGTISNLASNFVYDFQIDSICSGGVGSSNVYQQIMFVEQTLLTSVASTTVNISQDPMPAITGIDYQLCLSGTPVNTTSATGPSPIASFTGVASGTYTIKYRYSALVNGVTVYSDSSFYTSAWFESDPFTV